MDFLPPCATGFPCQRKCRHLLDAQALRGHCADFRSSRGHRTEGSRGNVLTSRMPGATERLRVCLPQAPNVGASSASVRESGSPKTAQHACLLVAMHTLTLVRQGTNEQDDPGLGYLSRAGNWCTLLIQANNANNGSASIAHIYMPKKGSYSERRKWVRWMLMRLSGSS